MYAGLGRDAFLEASIATDDIGEVINHLPWGDKRASKDWPGGERICASSIY